MKKIYVDEESANELGRIRKIIGIIIGSLEEKINAIREGRVIEGEKDFADTLLGGNENILSAVYRLGNLMIKLYSFEAKGQSGEESTPLEDIDLEIMKNYLELAIDRKSELDGKR
ncbi:MAG: hypothetical protein LBB24_01660 [Rickettsiales bacterium]|jgi:hypothetical protein|nr:hypothetical protein [Rickettsiales bacterium]